MSFGGYGSTGAEDPFDGDPYGMPPPGYPPPGVPPTAEVNTLATLSVVFAFVFAPAGAVLGHVALAQIKRRNEPGRQRAILGLTLSYAVILLALIALVAWLLLGADNDDAGTPGPATTTTAVRLTPSIRSTVITPPPQTRPTVRVEALRVGDCVEIQNKQPDPNEPQADQVFIYRVRCEIRDDVFQVEQIVMNESQCRSGFFLYNTKHTVFACAVKYGQ